MSKLATLARRFRHAEGGNVLVETVMLFPVLFWAAFGLYVFWDGYKSSNKLQKATYTAADIVSRWQGTPLTVADANGIQNLMTYMIGENQTPRLRLTLVKWVQSNNRFEVQWSCSLDQPDLMPWTTASVQTIKNDIPLTADGGFQILVETELDFTPLFDNGLDAMTFNEFTPVRPRFEAVVFTNPAGCS